MMKATTPEAYDIAPVSTCSKDLNLSVSPVALLITYYLTIVLLGKHRKGSKDSDASSSDTSQRSSLNIPEASNTLPTSNSAHSTQSSLSAQTLPGRSARPVSEDFFAPSPSRPAPAPRPATEAVINRPIVSDSYIPSTHGTENIQTTSQSEQIASVPPPAPKNTLPPKLEALNQSPKTPITPQPQFSVQSSISANSLITSITPTRPGQITAYRSDMTSQRVSSYGGINGQSGTDGVLSPPMSPKAAFRSKGRLPSFTSSRAPSHNLSTMKTISKRANGGSSYKIGLVQESAAALKKRSMAELGAGVYQSVSNVSYVNFLEWIRSERLTTLPHKGSRWDKVLIRKLAKVWNPTRCITELSFQVLFTSPSSFTTLNRRFRVLHWTVALLPQLAMATRSCFLR